MPDSIITTRLTYTARSFATLRNDQGSSANPYDPGVARVLADINAGSERDEILFTLRCHAGTADARDVAPPTRAALRRNTMGVWCVYVEAPPPEYMQVGGGYSDLNTVLYERDLSIPSELTFYGELTLHHNTFDAVGIDNAHFGQFVPGVVAAVGQLQPPDAALHGKYTTQAEAVQQAAQLVAAMWLYLNPHREAVIAEMQPDGYAHVASQTSGETLFVAPPPAPPPAPPAPPAQAKLKDPRALFAGIVDEVKKRSNT